ncbi:hypothetical protein PHYC_03079 [Phycisphaerales bacterium]|nr:hypothetical protein PHYC_03079 [Phycisphaerales bacterium]
MALVDVLVGVIMLGVAVVVLMGLTGHAVQSQRSGENLQVAAMILDQQLNLVQARGPDDYPSRFDDAEGVGEAPYENFRYKVEISSGAAGEAFKVVATVTWEENGTTRSAVVETRIAPRLGDEPDPDRRPVVQPDRLAGGAI